MLVIRSRLTPAPSLGFYVTRSTELDAESSTEPDLHSKFLRKRIAKSANLAHPNKSPGYLSPGLGVSPPHRPSCCGWGCAGSKNGAAPTTAPSEGAWGPALGEPQGYFLDLRWAHAPGHHLLHLDCPLYHPSSHLRAQVQLS